MSKWLRVIPGHLASPIDHRVRGSAGASRSQDEERAFGRARAGGIVFLEAMVALEYTPGPARGNADTFSKHVVVAGESHAALVGREILRNGGNAIDAAIGTAFALAVTLPEAGNLGGGGFIVAYLADRREVVTIDFREMAPVSATPTMYLGPDGKPRARYRAGAWAAGVPGTVRGLGLAHEKFGKTAWADLVRPAARLAGEGFPISAALARSLNRQLAPPEAESSGRSAGNDFGRLGEFPESIAAFGKPDRARWKPGDRLAQGDLAHCLDRIATLGADEFYTGRTAKLIGRYMAEKGGFISVEDLRAYQAKLRPAVHTTFRGSEVYSVGPPSSGGIVLCQMLNILENFDLRKDGRESPISLHRITEAMRRGFFTRADEIGDPDFATIPVAKLISREYSNQLASSIGPRATPSRQLAPYPIIPAESEHTTHLSCLDAAGNAVALTYTLEDSYGAKCVVAGAGFLLNDEMGDFNVVPGRTDTAGRIGTAPNLIAPKKRMLSSQTPTVILKDGHVQMVTGSPGGRTIPNTTLWVVLNYLEFALEPLAAVNAPRTHHQWFPDELVLEGRSWPEQTRSSLRDLGHSLKVSNRQGVANTIIVDCGTMKLFGIADQRSSTATSAGD
jgi:gamma-glutamyltranspeptidase/glutathione hydrolase